MLVNKINIFPPTNNVNNKSFVQQNHPNTKPLECDTFVKFTGAKLVSDAETVDEIRDMLFFLREDPKHAERKRKLDVELLYIIAMLDVLTGLKNKRAFFADIEKDIEKAKKEGETISVAMFDMDNFKSINDLFDHKTGDEFLKVIGQEIDKAASENNYQAYRYGGEEFIITMPGANLEIAAIIAEEIRKGINENPQLQAYYDDYLISAQKKIAELQTAQKPFVDFKHRLKEYEVREYDFKNLEKKGADAGTIAFLKENLTDSMKILKASLQKLLEHAFAHATSENDKKYLGNKIKSLNNGGNVKIEYDEDLKNYLNTNFNKEFEIAQIATWVNHVKKVIDGKHQGFTITAGVKEFKDLNIPVEDFIKKTDAILKKGKDEQRGLVYASAASI